MSERAEFEEYAPDAIRRYIVYWPRLLEMAQATGNGLGGGAGGGRGGRVTYTIIIADLERAADSLPAYWQATEFVYQRQRRHAELACRRRHDATPPDERQFEPPIPADALEQAYYRMSLALGWRPVADLAA